MKKKSNLRSRWCIMKNYFLMLVVVSNEIEHYFYSIISFNVFKT